MYDMIFDPNDEQQAFFLGDGEMYLSIQYVGDCYDYTIYYSDYSEYDGGQLDEPDMTMEEAVNCILESFDLTDLPRNRIDYDDLQAAVDEVDQAKYAKYVAQNMLRLDDMISSAAGKRGSEEKFVKESDIPER